MIAKNGVAGKLKNENPQLINIHCICHILALACVQSKDDGPGDQANTSVSYPVVEML